MFQLVEGIPQPPSDTSVSKAASKRSVPSLISTSSSGLYDEDSPLVPEAPLVLTPEDANALATIRAALAECNPERRLELLQALWAELTC